MPTSRKVLLTLIVAVSLFGLVSLDVEPETREDPNLTVGP